MAATDGNIALDPTTSEFLSPKEFAGRSGLSLSTVHRRLAADDIPHLQLGGRRHRLLIPCAALTAAITTHQQPEAGTCSSSAHPETHTGIAAPSHLSGRRPRWKRLQ